MTFTDLASTVLCSSCATPLRSSATTNDPVKRWNHLKQLGIELTNCRSQKEALELVMAGRCRTLIVDFDLPGAQETIRMAALLPPHQKPELLAIGSRAWPGTGQAFQSGASRILYKPLDTEPLREALMAGKTGCEKSSTQVHPLRGEDTGLP